MPSLVDSIVEGFPFPTVTPIVGEPNYETIADLHQQLNANAASVPSHLGNGVLGLLYLTVSPAVYANLSAVAFIPPVNPGPTPIIPARSTVPTTETIRARFVENTAIFKQYSTTDKALKQLLVGAVDEMFIRSLQTKYLGYLNVSTRQILDHLYAQYARISSSDLQDNDVKFKTPYDPNLPIESLFDQIENGIDYAAAGLSPYSTEQVTNNAYQLIYATGMFVDDCKVWKRHTAAYKTWDQFKLDFAESHREYRDARGTTAGATNYHANHANNAVYQEDTIEAIANLATATSHDRQAVSTLTATNSALTKELTSVNAKLVTALLANTKLTAQLGEKQANPTARQEARHYCWSCGYKQTHWGSKCPAPKEGHQKAAKAADTMGGSTANKPL
jgi:hypothetical protein